MNSKIILSESPINIEYGSVDGLDLPSENAVFLKIAKGSDFLGEYTITGNTFKVYLETKPAPSEIFYGLKFTSRKSYFFLDQEETEVLAQHSFKEMVVNGKPAIQNSLTWKSKKIKGFMKEWFQKFIVPKYDVILSDTGVSSKGLNFWKWMFSTFKQHGNFYIFDIDNKKKLELKKSSDMDKYHGWFHVKKVYMFLKK